MQVAVHHLMAAAAAFTVIILDGWTISVNAIICSPCYDPTTGDYIGPVCRPLPVDDPDLCEPAYRHCSCCVECAGKVDDVCHQMTPPCESHLMCTNEEGEEMHHIPLGNQFIGRCQLPLNRHLQ